MTVTGVTTGSFQAGPQCWKEKHMLHFFQLIVFGALALYILFIVLAVLVSGFFAGLEAIDGVLSHKPCQAGAKRSQPAAPHAQPVVPYVPPYQCQTCWREFKTDFCPYCQRTGLIPPRVRQSV